MNYIGSKHKLANFLFETIFKTVGNDLKKKVFCDLFAGTGIVGRTFKRHVKQVIANDVEYYSFVLNRNYIGNHTIIDFQDKIDILMKKRALFFLNIHKGVKKGELTLLPKTDKKLMPFVFKLKHGKRLLSLLKPNIIFC